jgi:hypothetical protein
MPAEDRVRLSLRMTRSEARATVSTASDSCDRRSGRERLLAYFKRGTEAMLVLAQRLSRAE